MSNYKTKIYTTHKTHTHLHIIVYAIFYIHSFQIAKKPEKPIRIFPETPDKIN